MAIVAKALARAVEQNALPNSTSRQGARPGTPGTLFARAAEVIEQLG